MLDRRKVWLLGFVAALAGGAVILWLGYDQRRRGDEHEFMAAAAQGNVAKLGKLVESVNVNARLGEQGDTALHRAAARGQAEAVKLLLERGAEVDAVDDEGTTPLLGATYRGHHEVVKLLLEQGAAVDAQEMRFRVSALTHAVGRNDRELVRLLLNYGANPLLKSADGRTPLDRAEANGAADIVALLKRK
jgi:ankyrin repeat protein